MSHQTSPMEMYLSFWDSTPIGRSFCLRLCQHEHLSPQLILEGKVISAVIRLQNNATYHSQTQFIGTLISDDESQRLIYVIDRLLVKDSTTNEFHNHQPLTGEFLIPIQFNNKNFQSINKFKQDGIKAIDNYGHSSLPFEVHHSSYLCCYMTSINSTCLNIDLSFNLLTIKNNFTLTPISPDYIQILPTALFKKLSSSIENTADLNQSCFGYCSLDRTSKNKILLILENDPQACSLPLVGIWVSNIVNIQSSFVWAACIRYYMNSSLQQRLRSGINSQQSFLLAFFLSTLHNQWVFYEVCSIQTNSTSLMTMDYDVWTCSKTIIIPNSALNQFDLNSSAQVPYDFEFKRVYDVTKTSIISSPSRHQTVKPMNDTRFPRDISLLCKETLPNDDGPDNDNDQHHATLLSPTTNGSLFGVPRIPPKQSIYVSPSWDPLSTTTIKTPKRNIRRSTVSPRSKQVSPVVTQTITNDIQWKEEIIARMQSYDSHIQSLTALVAQLLVSQNQMQQNSILTPISGYTKRDVAVQSEPLSLRSSLSSSNISNIEYCQQQRTSYNATTANTVSCTKFQSPLPSSFVHQHEPTVDCYSSIRTPTTPLRSKSPSLPVASADLNPVDILKPIFQFIDTQQQKQQQQQSTASLVTTYNSTDRGLFKLNNKDTDNHTEDTCPLTNSIQPQQQHVTSTRTTGISFISNGVQMQFINQRSSTTTLFSQSQSLHTSPQKSENNISIEVHGLEMKYLEDDQLAVAIECDRKAQKSLNILPETSQIVDKSLSFESKEYLRRYDLFTDSNR
ncbi:unnamed protein product [Rotaria socialis]|uniref:STIL N-terminal domain-containing protein n=1 Tax=Rotaria socialis TaxID=392032 RepID=A0A820SZY9_9BILA|nr:unnamed protein product [Rotaria socialis]CAF3359878.1 unnamed protein product [Rotaria socialis]CAF3452728.1 unnamed protein product [Rotaria socialis]CAF3496685.1 unnamed protein product [Rotaria socialis]CAF4199298.1 unnamed protein product [Rotaria socialis]